MRTANRFAVHQVDKDPDSRPPGDLLDELLAGYVSILELAARMPWVMVVRSRERSRWMSLWSTRVWIAGWLLRFQVNGHVAAYLDDLIAASRRELAFRDDPETLAQVERLQHFRASVVVPAHSRIVLFAILAVLFALPVAILGADDPFVRAAASAVTLDGVGLAEALGNVDLARILEFIFLALVPIWVVVAALLGSFRLKRILFVFGTRAYEVVATRRITDRDSEDLDSGVYHLERALLQEAGGDYRREVPLDYAVPLAVLGTGMATMSIFAIGARPVHYLPPNVPVLSQLLAMPMELPAVWFAVLLGFVLVAVRERWGYRWGSTFDQRRVFVRGLILGAVFGALALMARSAIH